MISKSFPSRIIHHGLPRKCRVPQSLQNADPIFHLSRSIQLLAIESNNYMISSIVIKIITEKTTVCINLDAGGCGGQCTILIIREDTLDLYRSFTCIVLFHVCLCVFPA